MDLKPLIEYHLKKIIVHVYCVIGLSPLIGYDDGFPKNRSILLDVYI